MYPVNRNNDDKEEMHHQIVLYIEQEPAICKWFGCGRTLTSREQLFGDHCKDHNKQKKFEIRMVIKNE